MTSFERLERIQSVLDKKGTLLKFKEKSLRKPTVKKVLDLALDLEKTLSVKNGREQKLGTSRSLHDLYCICKYYVPTCTIHDVAKHLHQLRIRERLFSVYCHDWERRMYKRTIYGDTQVDIYGI